MKDDNYIQFLFWCSSELEIPDYYRTDLRHNDIPPYSFEGNLWI